MVTGLLKSLVKKYSEGHTSIRHQSWQ